MSAKASRVVLAFARDFADRRGRGLDALFVIEVMYGCRRLDWRFMYKYYLVHVCIETSFLRPLVIYLHVYVFRLNCLSYLALNVLFEYAFHPAVCTVSRVHT